MQPERVHGLVVNGPHIREQFIIGKRIKKGDTIRWMNASGLTEQGVITGFNHGSRILSSIITDTAVLGEGIAALADTTRLPCYPLENIIGIGMADCVGRIQLVQPPPPPPPPSGPVSWGSPGAPRIQIHPSPQPPLLPGGNVSWGSPGAPRIQIRPPPQTPQGPGGGRGKLRHGRRSRRTSFRRGRRAGKSYKLTTATRRTRFIRK